MSLFEEEGSACRSWLGSTAGASEGTSPTSSNLTCEWLQEPRGRWERETSRVEWGQGWPHRGENRTGPGSLGEAPASRWALVVQGVVSTCIPWMVRSHNGLAIKPCFVIKCSFKRGNNIAHAILGGGGFSTCFRFFSGHDIILMVFRRVVHLRHFLKMFLNLTKYRDDVRACC